MDLISYSQRVLRNSFLSFFLLVVLFDKECPYLTLQTNEKSLWRITIAIFTDLLQIFLCNIMHRSRLKMISANNVILLSDHFWAKNWKNDESFFRNLILWTFNCMKRLFWYLFLFYCSQLKIILYKINKSKRFNFKQYLFFYTQNFINFVTIPFNLLFSCNQLY